MHFVCILSADNPGAIAIQTHSLAESRFMIYDRSQHRIVGPTGNLVIPADDPITPRLLMLIEGECEGLGPMQAAQKHGLSRQRYYQLHKQFQEQGALGLQNQKCGPKTNSVRTDEVERQVIRHRFLDPDASVDLIAQKLRQAGFEISTRSVERVIEKYGLQKKTLSLSPRLGAADRGPNDPETQQTRPL
jgi:transposase